MASLGDIGDAFEKAIPRQSARRAVLQLLLDDIDFCAAEHIPHSLTFLPKTNTGRLFTLTAGVNTEILFASLDGSAVVNCSGSPRTYMPTRTANYAAARDDQYALVIGADDFSHYREAIQADHLAFIDQVGTRQSDGQRVAGTTSKTFDTNLVEYAKQEIAKAEVRYAVLMYDPEKDPEVAAHFHDGPLPDLKSWSRQGFRTLKKGDVAILRRTGNETRRGLIGLGRVARDQGPQDDDRMLAIDWEHTQSEPLISRSDARISNIDKLWGPSPGGIELDAEIGAKLIQLLKTAINDDSAVRSSGVKRNQAGTRQPEGDPCEVIRTEYGRSSRNRILCIEAYGSTWNCFVCEMNFADLYGADIGHEFIHVHHRNPLSQGLQNPDPLADLVPICPNCHAMLHRRLTDDTFLSPEKLRNRLKRARK